MSKAGQFRLDLVDVHGDRLAEKVDVFLRHRTLSEVRATCSSASSSRGDQWMADVDIDDDAGFRHLYQVVRNTVTGEPTHPFDIHQILSERQAMDPGYRFVLYE
jgi:hypothetical protein